MATSADSSITMVPSRKLPVRQAEQSFRLTIKAVSGERNELIIERVRTLHIEGVRESNVALNLRAVRCGTAPAQELETAIGRRFELGISASDSSVGSTARIVCAVIAACASIGRSACENV